MQTVELKLEFCKKILSHSANLFSNLLTRSDQRILGILTSKYCRQYFGDACSDVECWCFYL